MLSDNWQTAYSAVTVLLLIDILVGFTQVCTCMVALICVNACVCMRVILIDDLQWEL